MQIMLQQMCIRDRIAVDAVSTGLYIYKGLDFTAGLYALYTIIAIFGYFKWRKMMSKDEGLSLIHI